MTTPRPISPSGGTEFPKLLAPFQLRRLELRNRIVFQPHFTALTDDCGMPTEDLGAYFVERAIGGVGLLIDGHFAVMPEGVMSKRNVHAWDPALIPGYREITDAVHAEGTRMFGQLTHGGHTTLEDPPHALWAPSQLPEPSSQYTTRAMDLHDLRRTVDAFAMSARNIVEAGFDGIEIKIAHDGLLRSFVSPFFNRRADAYGGTFDGRLRLPLEVLAAVREAVGPELPLGVRLCLHEYTPFGYDLEYGLRIAAALEVSGLVDYFNCDAGSFSSFWMEIPPAAVEQGFFRPLNRELKRQTRLPVIAFGRIKQPDMAERMLQLGEADLIGMARQLIADPETPRKLLEGRSGEVRACIGCNDGCIQQVMQVEAIRCIQNPGAGQERRYGERRLVRSASARHVVVVGGGVAGLKTAEIAARRGHRVTLLERSAELGGQVRLAARQPLHEEVVEVVHYLEPAIRRLGVEVWLNAEADVEGLLELQPDVIVVATGSTPDLPRCRATEDGGSIARGRGLAVPNDLPGLDSSCVRSVDEVLGWADGENEPGRALLIDHNGHWEAAGTAERLADQGWHVEVVTARAEVGFGLEPTNRVMFHQRARDKGIAMTPAAGVQAITGDGAVLEDLRSRRERRIEGMDLVVPVYPRVSRDNLFLELLDRIEPPGAIAVHRVGDASAPRLIGPIVLAAHQLAMEL